MSKLSLASVELARTRPRVHDPQPELPDLPPPMTSNRARDFPETRRCEVASAYADELDQFRGEQRKGVSHLGKQAIA